MNVFLSIVILALVVYALFLFVVAVKGPPR